MLLHFIHSFIHSFISFTPFLQWGCHDLALMLHHRPPAGHSFAVEKCYDALVYVPPVCVLHSLYLQSAEPLGMQQEPSASITLLNHNWSIMIMMIMIMMTLHYCIASLHVLLNSNHDELPFISFLHYTDEKPCSNVRRRGMTMATCQW